MRANGGIPFLLKLGIYLLSKFLLVLRVSPKGSFELYYITLDFDFSDLLFSGVSTFFISSYFIFSKSCDKNLFCSNLYLGD